MKHQKKLFFKLILPKFSVFAFALTFQITHVHADDVSQLPNPGGKTGNQPARIYRSPFPDTSTDSQSLRSLGAKLGIYIGTASQPDYINNDSFYRQVLGEQFNSTVPENQLKWDAVHPFENTFDFSKTDQIADYALSHNMKMRGHTLAWHDATPGWVYNYYGTQLQNFLVNHIQTVMGHYRDKYPGLITTWDVVNEAFDNNQSIAGRNSVWSRIGNAPDDYIKIAFQTARATDPSVKLCYNDYANDGGWSAHADAVFNYVNSLKNQGIPIDCVGLQMHSLIPISYPTSYSAVIATMQKYNSIGIEVQVTELDYGGQWYSNYNDASAAYATGMQACIDSPNCTNFTLWGFSNNYSYISAIGFRPFLPFDSSNQKSPSYYALQNTLQKALDLIKSK